MPKLLLLILLAAQAPRPPQSATITGRVLGLDGNPAAKVRVIALDIPEGRPGTRNSIIGVAETDANGLFRIEGLPPNRYHIAAGLIGELTYFPGVPSRTRATTINTSSGVTIEKVEFRLIVRPPLSVSGRVIAPPDQMNAVQVRLTPGARQRPPGLGAATPERMDANPGDGRFEFKNVAVGSYQVEVSGSVTSVPMTVEVVDEDITDLVIWPVEVTGSITMENGGPLPPFRLEFTETENLLNASVVAFGSIEVPAATTFRVLLWKSEFRVTAKGLPPGFFLKSVTAGSTDGLADPLKILPSEDANPIAVKIGTIAPSPWVKVAGRFTGPVDKGAAARVYSSVLAEPVMAPLHSDGSFEFPKLLPGFYAIDTIPLSPFSLPTAMFVGAEGLADFEFGSPTLRRITGRIEVEGGGLLPTSAHFSLTWRPPTRAPAYVEFTTPLSTATLPDGSFSLTLPEGESMLRLESNQFPKSYSVRAFLYGKTDLLKDFLRITPSSSEQLRLVINVNKGGLGLVQGQVVHGGPVGPVLTVFNGEGIFQTELAPDGSFAISGIAPGTWSFEVSSPSAIPLPSNSVEIRGNKDRIEISVPQVRQILARAKVAGEGAPPRFTLSLTGKIAAGHRVQAENASGVAGSRETAIAGYEIDVAPQPEGTSVIRLPEGEYHIRIAPAGDAAARYIVKSVVSGGTNLLEHALKIADSDTEIDIVFERRPAGKSHP